MTLPQAWLDEYLSANSLGTRLAILAGRSPLPLTGLEAALELSIEAYWLFQRFPLPDALEARILDGVDALEGALLVRASGQSCGAAGIELRSAATRAELLYAIRAAWSRAFSPASLHVPAERVPAEQLPAERVPAWPRLSIVQRSSTPPEELALADLWSERLSDGRPLSMAPQALRSILEAAAAGKKGAAPLSEIAAYARYALGCSYNSVIAPADPFEFLELLASSGAAQQALKARYLALSQVGGVDGQAYIDLAARSLALEAETVPPPPQEPAGALAGAGKPQARPSVSMGPSVEPALAALGLSSRAAHEESASAQQLIGSPSSPGCATGVLRRATSGGDLPAAAGSAVRAGEALVLACERFHRGLLALEPAAVIERQGGRLGGGALLARAEGLPCVSGVRDADMLPEGASVRVDGWLGIVSVAAGRRALLSAGP